MIADRPRAMVDAALARARRLFARYPAGAAVDGTDLAELAYRVVSTVGDGDDLRHALPDLLQGSWGGTLGVHPAVVSTKLAAAGWRAWPVDEQAAVDELLRALFLAELAARPGPVGAIAAVCAVAEATDDLQPFLDDWHLLLSGGSRERAGALHHLVVLANRAVPMLAETGGLRGLFWTSRPRPEQQVVRWLLGQTTQLQLERATYDFAPDPMAPAVAAAAEHLAALRAARTQ